MGGWVGEWVAEKVGGEWVGGGLWLDPPGSEKEAWWEGRPPPSRGGGGLGIFPVCCIVLLWRRTNVLELQIDG